MTNYLISIGGKKNPVAIAPGSDKKKNPVAIAPGSDKKKNPVAIAPGSDRKEPRRKESMADSWQIVRQRLRKGREQTRMYVSLNRRGEIAMNEEAWSAIKMPYNVTLLYDAETRIIGVKFPVAADRHFFPARRYGRGRRMRIVRAARLLKQFGIEVAATLVFPNVEVRAIGREPTLILELDGALPIAR